jgi:hypothetical protein
MEYYCAQCEKEVEEAQQCEVCGEWYCSKCSDDFGECWGMYGWCNSCADQKAEEAEDARVSLQWEMMTEDEQDRVRGYRIRR